jgi:hypothetical protein
MAVQILHHMLNNTFCGLSELIRQMAEVQPLQCIKSKLTFLAMAVARASRMSWIFHAYIDA